MGFRRNGSSGSTAGRRLRRLRALLCGILLGCAPAAGAERPGLISIGVSPSLTATLECIAEQQGYFREQGLDVEVRTISSGIVGIEQMLSGSLSAASSTAIPVVLQGFRRSDFRIVATLATMANDTMLAVRPGSGIRTLADLRGKRIGCLQNGMPHFVLDLLLMQARLDDRDIRLRFAAPAALVDDLVAGRLDGVVVFGSYLDEIRARLGPGTVLFGDRLLTVLRSYLTMRAKFVSRWPRSVAGLLRAYIRAENFAAAQPARAMAIVARRLGMDPAKVRRLWPDCAFRVDLQQGLLNDLEDKAAWAVARGIVPNSEIPNYLRLFSFRALESIDPTRVSIVHPGER